MHFDSLQYMRINKVNELCKPVVKTEKFNFNLFSSNVIAIFRYYCN